MIVCLRTIGIPADVRGQYPDWIATPERDRLTASEVHRAVDYRPIARYDVVGGYLNIPGLAKQPDRYPIEEDTP
jgi:hypothetical protein